MRLTLEEVQLIRDTVRRHLGGDAQITLFGSRVDAQARGGDVDLLIESEVAVEHPAVIIARIASGISLGMHERKVDVLLMAPNLMISPIHQIARQTGVRL